MSEIEAAGTEGSLSTGQLDITDDKSIEQAVALVQEKFGRLDVLVNNAAVGSVDPDAETRFRLSMDTNLVGPAVVSASFRPLLLKSRKPYSIYVSSGQGSMGRAADSTSPYYRDPIPNGNAYRASKAALNMVALQESIECESTPMKVFAMCPEFVRSKLRGHTERLMSGWSKAGDPMVSGQTILSIIRGERDADAGHLVHKDGVYPW